MSFGYQYKLATHLFPLRDSVGYRQASTQKETRIGSGHPQRGPGECATWTSRVKGGCPNTKVLGKPKKAGTTQPN